jgi:hypothetical protein
MTETEQENSQDREHRIREHAYHLWEANGCPEGRSEEYWKQATASINDETVEARANRSDRQGTAGGRSRRARNSRVHWQLPETAADPQQRKDR